MKISITLATLGLVLSGCENRSQENRASSFAVVKQERELRVGYVPIAPWIIKDPNTGALSGSLVDSINSIGRASRIRITFVEESWGTFVAGLQSRRYDLSIVPAFLTIPRAESLAFTDPVTCLGNSALVRRGDARFTNVYDLNRSGVRIAVVQGEQGHDFARVALGNATLVPIATNDLNVVFTEVLTGRVDAALGDIWYIDQFSQRHEGVTDIAPGRPYSTLPASWAVRYGDDDLRLFINTSLTYLRGTGQTAVLNQRYQVPQSECR